MNPGTKQCRRKFENSQIHV